MICDRFKILPNDPRLLELTDFQKLWAMENIKREADQMAEAYSDKKSGMDFGLPDKEYADFSKEMKKEAERQAAEGKVQKDEWKKQQTEQRTRLKPDEIRDT